MTEIYVRVPRQDEKPELIVTNTPEVETQYVDPNDRFIVSMVVGYSDEDIRDNFEDGARPRIEAMAKVAASAALQLTRDEGSNGTRWFVFDRKNGQWFAFEQDEFEDISIR